MPRKNLKQVIVDPVAAAAQLEPATDGLVPLEPPPPAPTGVGSSCAFGHANAEGTRFCPTCGVPMDQRAVSPVDLAAARPKPAEMLTAAERAERDRQHAEALAAARAFEAEQPVYVPAEGQTVTVHFIEDGFTFAGTVWMRGQEITIGPAHPRWPDAVRWILLDRAGQIGRYGKQFFEKGPWPFGTTYLDGMGSYERLSAGKDADGNPVTFAGPGEEALRQAAEAERRRAGGVPVPAGDLR